VHGTNRRIVGIVAGIALLFVLGPAALANAATGKLYSLKIPLPAVTYEAPGSGLVASGQTVTMTATFTNEAATQQIGSANLFWPTGFSATVQSSSSGSVSVSQNCTDQGVAVGPCVELRNLALAPNGGSVTVTMLVATPACGLGGDWSAEVKQANNFNGTPGNDFTFDPSVSPPSTTLDGACSLAFVNEPHNELLGNPIDGKTDWWFPLSSIPATAVTVEALGGVDGKTVISGYQAPVTVGLAQNPGPVGLVATGNVATPVNGTASFSDLELGAPANGYVLNATSGTLAKATSSPSPQGFDVAGAFAQCSGNSCHTDASGTNGDDGSVTANVVSGSGLLLESANANNGAPLTCSGPTPVDPNTYSFATTGNLVANKVFTITILGVPQPSGPLSKFLKAQQICFGAPADLGPLADFTTASGMPAGSGVLPDGTQGFIGVLPNCTGSTPGPCHDQKSDSATLVGKTYTVKLVADVPSSFPGDPYMR
jgi:hypothetical protein